MGDYRRGSFQHTKYKGNFQGKHDFREGRDQNSSHKYPHHETQKRSWTKIETAQENMTQPNHGQDSRSQNKSQKHNMMQTNLVKLSETEFSHANKSDRKETVSMNRNKKAGRIMPVIIAMKRSLKNKEQYKNLIIFNTEIST